jgi:pSer/pThr/pTyr-binding forkhead associated (FHA) protein
MIQQQLPQQENQIISMPVTLIMTQGSHAGTAAPIHPGYYLVGRHKQCQIRPKSRSVSRRHCLLLSNDDGFGALDLKSTGGTYVNGQRLQPRQWRTLGDGDQIRFGKVAFSVSIQQPSPAVVSDHIVTNTVNDAVTNVDRTGSLQEPRETPDSFNHFDVAEFLDSEEEAEFEERSTGPHETFLGEPPDDEAPQCEKILEVDPAPKKRPPRRTINHDEYKRASKRTFSLPSLGNGLSEGVNWKLVGTIAMFSVAIGLFAYQSYRFQSGPTMEVRQNLD